MGLATSALRMGLGGIMAGHGLQKLAGKFGGPGLDGASQGFEAMGFKPGRQFATAAGAAETVGGGLLATGLLTPFGAAMVTGVMTSAILKVHRKNGLWVTDGGMEYNLMIIAAAFAVTEHGPGFPALDGLITKRRKGIGWALFELAVGVAAGVGVVALAERDQATSSLTMPGTSDSSSSAGPATDDSRVATSGPAGEVPGTSDGTLLTSVPAGEQP